MSWLQSRICEKNTAQSRKFNDRCISTHKTRAREKKMNEMDITFSRFNHSKSHTIESYCSPCKHLAAAVLLGDSQPEPGSAQNVREAWAEGPFGGQFC